MKKLSRAMAKSLKPKKPSSSLPYPLARSPLLHAPSAKSQQLPRTPRMAPPATASASASAPVSLLFLSLPLSPSSCRGLPAPHTHLPPRRLALAPARLGAALLSSLGDAQEEEEYDDEEEEELVVVGYVSGAHGVRGDVLVSPRTDFPQLRFATPGKRWLRARAAGKQQVKEFELVRGRAHTGKKSWIVTFDGVDSVDEVWFFTLIAFLYSHLLLISRTRSLKSACYS